MNKKKVLFSPLGGTDPISNYRDGSMLHICRIYKPDKVVLYLSKEICEYHKNDNRYLYCLERLSEYINHSFEVEIIERPDLVNVFDFDFFYKEFEPIIRRLHEENYDEILLNVSSGTPAMKSALNILSELIDIKLIPIQVVTPEGKINPREEDKEDYDVEIYWELNKDNDSRYFYDRTILIKNKNQTAMFVVNNIREFIDAYDYYAALKLADNIKEFLSEETLKMINVACKRESLDYSNYTKLGGDKKWMPIQDGDVRDIIEYILILQVKIERKEYADFLRAITPVFFELCKLVVDKKCRINLNELTYIEKDTGGMRWKRNMKTLNKEIYNFFIEKYGSYSNRYVSSEHLTKLIYEYDNDMKRRKLFEEFRGIEIKVRNIAAHNLVCITDSWIKRRCGYTVNQIVKKLRELAVVYGIRIDKSGWESYELMNEKIKSVLAVAE